jgi:hypothetical protein
MRKTRVSYFSFLHLFWVKYWNLKKNENAKIHWIYFDIQRTQGTDGRVTVDMATQPGTAVTDIDLSLLTLTPVQVISAIQVVSFEEI